jgi:hypothetical protein
MSRRHSINATLVDHKSADVDAGTDLNALTFGNVRKSDIAANLPVSSCEGAALASMTDPFTPAK